MLLPLSTIEFILDFFLKELRDYSYKKFKIDDFKEILIIEDSLLLYIEIIKKEFEYPEPKTPTWLKQYNNKYKNNPYVTPLTLFDSYYELYIEELTPNTIDFNTKHTQFIHELEKILVIEDLSSSVKYTQFKGFFFNINEKDFSRRFPYVLNKSFPELKIKERYLQWDGIPYNFIIMRMYDYQDIPWYHVEITRNLPHVFITSLCNTWIKKGMSKYDTLYHAFKSRSKEKRQYILENFFSYTVIPKSFREKFEANKYAKYLKDNISNISITEWIKYNRPINKWKSEEKLLKLVKSFFKGHKVIYQFKPLFLKSDLGHQMSYDIYVPHLRLAIEYQGKQHFEPVSYFGGAESFKRTVQRDKLKKEISLKNNITLLYFNYWDDINTTILSEKISKEIHLQKYF